MQDLHCVKVLSTKNFTPCEILGLSLIRLCYTLSASAGQRRMKKPAGEGGQGASVEPQGAHLYHQEGSDFVGHFSAHVTGQYGNGGLGLHQWLDFLPSSHSHRSTRSAGFTSCLA